MPPVSRPLALFGLLLALLVATARAHAEEPPRAYTEAVRLGVEEFEAKNFLEARTHLMRAHDLYPNARTLRGLGMVEFELKNYAEAARYLYEALTVKEKPLEGEKRAEAEQLYQRASGYLARITLDIGADTTVLVDGSRTDLSAGEDLVLTLGKHELEFRASDRISDKRVLQIKGGESYKLHVRLAPVSEKRESLPPREDDANSRRPVYKSPWLWTALGLVVAGAAAGTAVALTRDPGTRTQPVDTGDAPRPLRGGAP